MNVVLYPAERIRLLRENKNISQKKLAEDLLIGQSTMSEYENGIKQPPLSVLIKIADYFGVSLDYLAGRTNIKPTIDLLQENLSVRPGKTIAVDDLVHLGTDEKEAIRSLIDIFKKTKSK
ncbi:MAG: helix-turn-helix transcriptional regulator [Oscillospiraceae bacterium]|nr:helix-turn-helix transcriptional regulator [Oscillospiraceae bacterium]